MFRAPCLCLALLACQPTAAVGTRAEAIVGGEPAPLDEAVFFVDDDAGVCSATLIAPRTLLLAAHCVQEGAPMVAHNRPRVGEGDAGTYVVVERQTWAQATDGGTADLALVLLDRPPPVTPRPWTWWGPPPAIGTRVRHVGYGRSESAPPGERRAVVTEVTGATEARAHGLVLLTGTVGRGLCFGDSGGPTLVEEDGGSRVVAVHSFITTECGAGVSSSVLLFPYRRFLEHWLADHEPPQCARDGRCVGGCQPEDPDCRCGLDGVCRADCPPGDDLDCANACSTDGLCSPRTDCAADTDCVPDGAFCLGPAQCAGRVCTSDAQNPSRYCSQACDAQRPCPAELSCDLSRGVCQLRQRPLVARVSRARALPSGARPGWPAPTSARSSAATERAPPRPSARRAPAASSSASAPACPLHHRASTTAPSGRGRSRPSVARAPPAPPSASASSSPGGAAARGADGERRRPAGPVRPSARGAPARRLAHGIS
ncbi:MAG: trypsin-like serine protease [Myxococcaceae bacterium]|nr:trypsin-like serine protease [Myxococcaceae bacterium]